MFGSSVYWLTPSPTFYLVKHRLTIDLVNTPSNAGNPNSYEYAISGGSGDSSWMVDPKVGGDAGRGRKFNFV